MRAHSRELPSLFTHRDLAALGDKIKSLDEKANKLRQSHPEAAEQIYDLQKELNEQWNRFVPSLPFHLYSTLSLSLQTHSEG